MALNECPECGELISSKAAKCPHCGITIKEIKKKRLKEKILTVSFPVGMLFLSVISLEEVFGRNWSGDPSIGNLPYWACWCGILGSIYCFGVIIVFIVRKILGLSASKTFRNVSVIVLVIFYLVTLCLCHAADDWTRGYIAGKERAVTGTYRYVYKGNPVIISLRKDLVGGDCRIEEGYEIDTHHWEYSITNKSFVVTRYDDYDLEMPENMSYVVIGGTKCPLKKISNKVLVSEE